MLKGHSIFQIYLSLCQFLIELFEFLLSCRGSLDILHISMLCVYANIHISKHTDMYVYIRKHTYVLYTHTCTH